MFVGFFWVCAAPFEESSSIGCLKAVMSLKVQRNRTTLSCSFLIGAIFTKNHTGIPAGTKRAREEGHDKNHEDDVKRTKLNTII